MELTTNDERFLSLFFSETLYKVEPHTAAVAGIQLPPVAEPTQLNEPKHSTATNTPSVLPLKFAVATVPEKPASHVAAIKVLVLLAYPAEIPSMVKDNFQKIFFALGLAATDYAFLNMLSHSEKPLEAFKFQYLLLMGGKGNKLPFLQNYTGNRAFFEANVHNGAKILFAHSMDVYLKPENATLKKDFWLFVKKHIQ